jgi:hypothetical protein
MGGLRRLGVWSLVLVAAVGCEKAEPKAERIEIAAADRSCVDGEACGVVETSCTSIGCECGVAVHESSLLDYQKALAECRGGGDLSTCDFTCETPFGKCFRGACVLTDEPPTLFRRGRNVQTLCERTRGTYLGCPECPPNERCRSCTPCECPTTDRWTRNGCRAVVKTEAREIRVEARPARFTLNDRVKTRVRNESKRTIWLETRCGTPFHRARRKEDAWDKGYETFRDRECETGAIELEPGKSRPFVVRRFADFQTDEGVRVTPGTYRFELSYTDGTKNFEYHGTVYSAPIELMTALSQR